MNDNLFVLLYWFWPYLCWKIQDNASHLSSNCKWPSLQLTHNWGLTTTHLPPTSSKTLVMIFEQPESWMYFASHTLQIWQNKQGHIGEKARQVWFNMLGQNDTWMAITFWPIWSFNVSSILASDFFRLIME